MVMSRRQDKQPELFIPTHALPEAPAHPFYNKLNAVLAQAGFDPYVEGLCQPYYDAVWGRPSGPPGSYFRMLCVIRR